MPTPISTKLLTPTTHVMEKNLVLLPLDFSLNKKQFSHYSDQNFRSFILIISDFFFFFLGGGGSFLLNSGLSTELHNQDLWATAL